MAKIYEITNPKAKAWFEKANKFIDGQPKDNRTLHILKYGDKELDAWVYYFDTLGWRPVFIQRLLDGLSLEATVPAAWPHWFDLSYTPPEEPPPHPRRYTTPRALRESYEELKARFGSNWGLRAMDPAKPKPKWQRPTDDDLRAHYGTRKDE